ncbi:MAG: cytochrome P450 [Mycobacteriaceae bacterium]
MDEYNAMTRTVPSADRTRHVWGAPVTAPGPPLRAMVTRIRSIQLNPLNFLMESWRQYGDVVQFPFPPFPLPTTYMVSSPQGARDVLLQHHKLMSKRTLQYSTLSMVTGEGLLTAETDRCKTTRRQLAPAFHQDMIRLATERVADALARLDESWAQLTADGPALIDVDQTMMNLALEITGATLFSTDLTEQADQLTAATLGALHCMVQRVRFPLPMPLAVPTPGNLRMRRAIRQLDAAVDAIIEQRLADRLPAGQPIRDMLDVLTDPTLAQPFSRKQIRDEVATFIVAGHETLASALTWAWYLLGANPDEAERLHDEPQRASSIFDETLRLYPPAWVISRRTIEPVDIDGFHIPANAIVIVSPWIIHRNPAAWESPEQFLPDRFTHGAPLLGYLPFGAGPRLCIGRDMALMQGAQILGHIAQHWKLDPTQSQHVQIEASATLRPRGGMPMRLRRL